MNSVAAAKRYRAAEWATKPLLMPVLAALALAAAVPRQEAAVMPTYVAAQLLLAAGFLRGQRDTAEA